MNTPFIFLKFAARSLFRNPMRTSLSVIGVAVSCSLALAMTSLIRAENGMLIRSIAEGGVGHFKVVPKGFDVSHDPALRLNDFKQQLAELRVNPLVRVATPRARLQAMLAMGTKMTGVEVVGVDPTTEPDAYRYVRTLSEGRYLKPGESRQMVIGKAIADRLSVGIGDSVVATVIDNSGEMKSEMFEIVGIVSLGSKQFEATICQVSLADLESLVGIKGAAEIAVLAKNAKQISQVMDEFQPMTMGNELLRWDEISPDVKFAVVLHEVMAQLLTLIFIFVAFVGVASAQLTSVLERRTEFAVLSAIGLNARRVLILLMSEAAVLSTLAFFATVLLSGPAIYYLSQSGIRVLGEKSITVVGTVIEPFYFPDFGSWFFVYAAIMSYAAMFAAFAYPAYLTMRLNPAQALRVAQ